jgi:hypothetical protein
MLEFDHFDRLILLLLNQLMEDQQEHECILNIEFEFQHEDPWKKKRQMSIEKKYSLHYWNNGYLVSVDFGSAMSSYRDTSTQIYIDQKLTRSPLHHVVTHEVAVLIFWKIIRRRVFWGP